MNLFHRRQTSPISDPARFRELYEQNRLPVFRYVYALTSGSQADADDLAAETFLRAWKARHQFDGDLDSATGWLIRIAKRLVIDDHRRALRTARGLPFDLDAESTPEQDSIRGEQQRILLRLVADLPDEPREILVLRYLLGWRVIDIARHLGVTENKISVGIHRTLSQLREAWADLDPESPPAIHPKKEKQHEARS